MRILFVEDNRKFSDDVAPLLREIAGVREVILARDRDSAKEALSHSLVDLIVLDLRIPPNPGSMAAAKEHGQSVFHHARSVAPGTPVFILTGSEPDEFSRRLARFGEQLRLWGAPDLTETVSYFAKEETDQLVHRISEIAKRAAPMATIELNTRGRDFGFSEEEERILRSFTRRASGVSCDVKRLSGGLSGVKVLQATAKDAGGRVLLACAGKLGDSVEIEQENAAYESYVKRLRVGAYPTQFCVIDHGVRQTHGIFYTLADDMIPMFEMLEDPDRGFEVVRRVRTGLERWISARQVSSVTVRDIRRKMFQDKPFQAACSRLGVDYSEVESIELRASQSVIHGDLHCGNVLVDPSGNVVVIDFGDVGPGYSCLDPVTMELSLLFHPDAVRSGFSGDLVSRISHWPDVDIYMEGQPLAETIGACRDWAYDVSGGDLDVLAAGYAYGVRQLRYDTVDHDVTLNLINNICAKLTK